MSQWKWMILWAVKGNINPTMIKMKQKERDNGRYFSYCEILVVILVSRCLHMAHVVYKEEKQNSDLEYNRNQVHCMGFDQRYTLKLLFRQYEKPQEE